MLEDESRNIGARNLPHYLADRMATEFVRGHRKWIFEERLERLWQEYVVERYHKTVAFFGPNGGGGICPLFARESVARRKSVLAACAPKNCSPPWIALSPFNIRIVFASHRHWLAALTQEYYDPMYSYQLEKKERASGISR